MTVLMSHFRPLQGFGYAATQIAEAWGKIEPDLQLVDMTDPPLEGGEWWIGGDAAVALCTPPWYEQISSRRLLGYTMFETTRLPDEHIRSLYYCHELIVPSNFCAEAFRNSNISLPIHVIPLGIDPQEDCAIERSHDGKPYTFLWSGTGDWRKGWDLVYDSFWKAFQGSKDVQLILHFRQPLLGKPPFNDENVITLIGCYPYSAMRQLYKRADCFVFPSHGEGWGLPPRQAAATGLPVIATNWGGMADDIEHWGIPLGIKGLVRARVASWMEGDIGEWADPDRDELVELMRLCYSNPDEAQEVGENASKWLRTNNSWDRTAQMLQDLVRPQEQVLTQLLEIQSIGG